MTCIVALEHEGKVWMGGDAAASCNNDIVRRVNPKVFIKGDFLIGYSGSFRIGQLLQYSFTPVKPAHKQSDMEYMVVSFIDSLREMLKYKGALMKEDEGDAQDSEFIVGYRGKIYVVESDFHLGTPLNPYAASGSGAPYALGALYALSKVNNISPQKKVEKALRASAEYCTGVCAPFTILAL